MSETPTPYTHFSELGRAPIPWAELQGRDLQVALAIHLFEWQPFPYIVTRDNASRMVYCPPGRVHISTVAEPSFTSDQVSEWMTAHRWLVDAAAEPRVAPAWECSVWCGGNGDAAQVKGATLLEALGRAALVAKAELARRQKKSTRRGAKTGGAA